MLKLIGFPLRAKTFLSRNLFMVIVTTLALVSCFFVPPSLKYFQYINFKTLATLFCLMLLTSALINIRVLRVLAAKLLSHIDSTRKLTFLLVLFPAVFGMFLSNDVSIITFAPFSLLVLSLADKDELAAPVLVLQLLATNSIGCLSPLGNSQSLYLFNFYHISLAEYMQAMLPFAGFSTGIICLLCLTIKNKPLEKIPSPKIPIHKTKCTLYLVFIFFVMLSVFDVLSFITTLPIIAISLAFVDRKAYKKVNYLMLFTFVMFFILAGNLRNISIVNGFLSKILLGNEFLLSSTFSLIISNTPTALILSQFTTQYIPLLIGVNIGKCGTIYASMNGIIAGRVYQELHPRNHNFVKKYYYYSLPFFVLTFAFGWFLIWSLGFI